MRGFIRNPYFIILAIAFIIRIILLCSALYYGKESFFLFDSYRYLSLGTHLFEDGIYAEKISDPLFESIFIPPGAPVLFHLLNSTGGIILIILTQIIAQLITCYYLIKSIQHVFNHQNKLWIFVGGLVFAFDIPTLVLGNVIMTETIFTFFLTISIYHLLRFFTTENIRFLIFSSVFMGCAVLFRPILIYFPVFISFFFLFIYFKKKQKMISFLFCFLTPFYLITGSWALRNYLRFDTVYYSYQANFNLFYYQAASIYSQENNISLSEARVKLMNEVKNEFQGESQIDQIEFYDVAGRNARAIILSHPTLFFKNMIKANVNLLLRPVRDYLKINLGSKELFHTRSKNNSVMINFLTYWQVMISGITLLLLPFGYLYFYKEHRKVFWLLIAFMSYFLLVCSGPEIEARFRVPLLPELIILAIGGICYLNEKFFIKKDIALPDNSTFVP